MLRQAFFAAALFAATLSSSAHSGDFVEGRVVAVVPNISFSFGTRLHDGYLVDYEFGGHRYSTRSHRHPGRVILVPPPLHVIPVGPHFGHRHWRNDHRGWDDHDRWDDRRHWRGDDRGRGRNHGRH